jgi:hypothetical protein
MKIITTLFLVIISLGLKAQVRCLTEEISANRERKESKEKFQKWWVENKNEKDKFPKSSGQHQNSILYIPVVFHVIHNGEIIGQGKNLATTKIEEQLAILNDDFARRNEDQVNTLSEFQSLAADIEIQFVLAKQDPLGLPSNGVVRVRGSKSSYATSRSGDSDDLILKSDSHWPSAHYLNIYVTDLTNGLGYAQFPFSNLEGLQNEFFNYSLTVGVVVDYNWFGVNLETGGSFQSYGRTLTHEVGHYLGLLHIWGLNFNCTSDDFCNDTPLQSGSTLGCDLNTQSCGNLNMVQNYMDYTDDVCMNVFTKDQKERMRIVAMNGLWRQSLLTSPALSEPEAYANDLGIQPIEDFQPILCSRELTPEVLIINYGSESIDNYTIRLIVNNNLIEQIEINEALRSLGSTSIKFSPIDLSLNQENIVKYELVIVDENSSNDELTIEYPNSQSILLPLQEDFEDANNALMRSNSSNWVVSIAPDSTAQNKALKIDYFDTELTIGQRDYLITPLLDVSSLNSAELSFSYAYADRANGVFDDGLIVGIIPTCEEFLTLNNIVFERYGSRLATTSPRESAYTPFGLTEWEQSSFNITSYLSDGLIQVVFIAVNGGGNNLYIDNIEVNSAELERLDLGIRSIEGISPTTCQKEVFPKIEFKNFGYEDIESLDLNITINDRLYQQSYDNIDIFSGFNESFTLSIRSLVDGENNVSIAINKINGEADAKANNNEISFKVIVNDNEEFVPHRETFDDPQWSISFTDDSPSIDLIDLDSRTVAKFQAFETTYIGTSSYVVSPLLNTNNQKEGAIRIGYSYASRNGYTDKLKVFLSNSCGRNYDIEVYNSDSEDFAIRKSEDEWVPANEEDWSEIFIDISEHMIWEELRVMVVFQNGGGNNLFIDDIEFLTSSDPDQIFFENRLTVFPVPAIDEFFVNVNMPFKETLNIQLIDMSGKIVFDENFPNSLNQTYRMLAPSQSGFYLLKVNGQQIKQTKRLYIRP